MRGQRANIALVIIGAAGIILGTFMLASGDGDDARGATVTTSEATTTTPTAGTSETTDTTVEPRGAESAAVEEFYAAFAGAVGAGDSAFLFDRLDPAVTERYGSDACLAYVERLTDPEYSVDVLTVSAPAPYSYETDGVTTPVDAVTVRIRHTPDGEPTETDAHVTLGDDGVRWLTDCGTPLARG